MTKSLIHYNDDGEMRWGVLFGEHVAPLPTTASTTGEVVEQCWEYIWQVRPEHARKKIYPGQLLSPLTANQKIIGHTHHRRYGKGSFVRRIDRFALQSPSSVAPAFGVVDQPPEVQALSHDTMLGLVFKKQLPKDAAKPRGCMGQWLAGLTMVNALRADAANLCALSHPIGDKFSWYCPVGPVLLLLSDAEWSRLPDLRLRICVNGRECVDSPLDDQLTEPEEMLSALGKWRDINIGDLVATGRPEAGGSIAHEGIGLHLSRLITRIARRAGVGRSLGIGSSLRLERGDLVQSSIRTDDGAIDLGEQCIQIAT